jgi:hypothetical protein
MSGYVEFWLRFIGVREIVMLTHDTPRVVAEACGAAANSTYNRTPKRSRKLQCAMVSNTQGELSSLLNMRHTRAWPMHSQKRAGAISLAWGG